MAHTRATFRLIHLADIVAVTTPAWAAHQRRRVRRRGARRPLAGAGAARRPRTDRDEGGLRRGPLRSLHGPARRRADALVHHGRAHGRRPAGDDDRGPARPSARACIRPHGRRAVRLLHPRPDRVGGRARRGKPDAVTRRDSTCDVGEPVPLRHLSQDRGGHQHVARLIRTEKEVEGRYEDVWIVVEEDALEQWPEGPLTTIGREVPRVDGVQRALGQARYTADLQLPGMLHAAVLRSPYARARVTKISLDAARSAPGVRAVIGPGDLEPLTDEPGYVGHAVAAVAAETFGQAQAAVRQIDVEWEVLEPLLDPDEAVRRESFVSEVKTYERGEFDRGVAEADVVVAAEYRTQVVLHNSMETHQAVCHWEDDGITVYISTQYIWGIRDSVAEHLGLPPDKVRVVCHAMGGGFGSKNSPGDYTPIAAELAKRTGRPVN